MVVKIILFYVVYLALCAFAILLDEVTSRIIEKFKRKKGGE